MEDNTIHKGKNIDKQSFEKLFRDNYKGLCMYAQNFIHDIDAIEDIIHDIFINLWEKKENILEDKSTKSYLYRSVHNRCLNFIRDNKKFVDNNDFFENTDIVSDSNEENAVETAELQTKIKNEIDNLPEKCREVFILSRFEELKYSEIAEKLNISIKTVENQISKALKTLRAKLGPFLTISVTCILFSYFLIKSIGVSHM